MYYKNISIRIPENIRVEVERASEEQTRSRSAQIVHYIKQGLIRDGFLDDRDNRKPEAP